MSRTYETSVGTLTVIDGQDDDVPERDERRDGDEEARTVPRLLLTPDEAAHVLGLRRSTLDDYARRGIVPSVRIGRHRRFLPDELRDYVAGL